ncbi:hypothetical protein T8K17_15480 [Thalassobaculum sp. OXR-137]|uniref:hypothetical protein n=1 Tax=Thalassobaculum sp. OXR-137 TaxID=3100173 RepID=UPI002AC89FFC|nr:hypothetical protein [Thalassobaculum sp. OXR-137]WPZ32641.1 hypothetical protein T8K17_15480 [Thalassobaculum sp. OXR-137]
MPDAKAGTPSVSALSGSLIAGLVLGATAAIAAVAFAGPAAPAHHPSFVAGESSFLGLGKGLETRFLWTLLLVSGLAIAGLEMLRARVQPELHRVLWPALMPAVYWLATRVIAPPTPTAEVLADTAWLFVSAGLVLLTVLLAGIGRHHPQGWARDAGSALLLPVLGVVSGIAVLTGIGRLDLGAFAVLSEVSAWHLAWFSALLTVFGLVGFCLPENARAAFLARLLRTAQLPLAAGFLCLLLPPAEVGGTLLRQGGLTGPALPILLALVAVGAAVGILLGCRKHKGPSLSPWAVAGAVTALKLGDGGAIAYAMDNPLDLYHHGEWLIPWDQYWRHGVIPYVDSAPSHGLINLAVGGVAALVGDGTMVGLAQGQVLVRGAALTVAALVLGRLLGGPAALLALVLLPFSGRTPILLLVASALAWFIARTQTRHPVAWLCAALAVCIALVGLAPGQGSIASVALLPVIVLMLWRAWQAQRRALLVAVSVVLALVALVVALGLAGHGPGPILWGQIRFILENRALYEAVHGLPWTASFTHDMPLGPVAWEVLRALWIPVAAGLVAVLVLAATRRAPGGAWIFMAVAVLVYLLGTVGHTLGRIDLGGPSRTGAQTVFALAILLPMVAAMLSPRHLLAALWLALVPIALLSPSFRATLNPLALAHLHQARDREEAGRRWIDGAAEGLPSLGTGLMSPSLVVLVKPVHALVESVLAEDETYLDLTDRNANYFYLRRPVPVESGAVATMATQGMQTRSIARLRADPPPLVLLDAAYPAGNPFPPPLRTPLLYRYLMAELAAGRYAVWSDGTLTALIEPGRAPSPPLSREEGIARLDAIWGRTPLEHLPTAWGASADTIAEDLTPLPATVSLTGGSVEVTLETPGTVDFLGLRLTCMGDVGDAALTWTVGARTPSFTFSPSTGLALLPLDIWPPQAVALAAPTARFALTLPAGCTMTDGAVWSRKVP